jgi:hypothetical protein
MYNRKKIRKENFKTVKAQKSLDSIALRLLKEKLKKKEKKRKKKILLSLLILILYGFVSFTNKKADV